MPFGIGDDFKGSIAVPPGSNLAGPGRYREQIAAVIPNLPALKYKPKLHTDDSRYYTSGRAAVYRFISTELPCPIGKPEIVTDSDGLRLALASPAAGIIQANTSELVILEGLKPDLIAIVGEMWQIPPIIIKRHEFTGFWTMDHHIGNFLAMPSSLEPSKNFSFNYWEIIYFDDEITADALRAAENHRNILITSIGDKRDRAGIVSRKATYWSRQRPGGGWQAVIIVDSPVDHVIVGKGKEAKIFKLGYEPFQGGYHDPASYASLEQMVATPGPPRTSTLDDLVHYFRHHGGSLDFSEPTSTTHFLKLIVYMNMTQVYHYTRGLFDQLEYKLDQRQNFALQNPEAILQPFWSDLHHFRWRLEFFMRNLANIVLQLGVDEFQISPLEIKNPVDKNFVYLKRQFHGLERRSSGIFESYGVLSQIASSQQSLLETKAAQNIQYLAFIFLPLSLAASLFSMQSAYSLGQENFWVYVVTATILLSLAMLGAWLLRSDTQLWLQSSIRRVKKIETGAAKTDLPDTTDVELQTHFKRRRR